jgi:hypothetical protein
MGAAMSALADSRCAMNVRYRMNGLTDYLFAMPSFWSGVGRTLDLGGQFDEFNWSPDPDESDENAIFSDFRAVGMDILSACSRYEVGLGREASEPTAGT